MSKQHFLCQFEDLCPWPVFPVWFIQTPTLSHWWAHKSFCSVLFILHFDKRSHQDFDYDKKTPLYRVMGPPHAHFLLNSLQWPLIRLQINELTQIINYISTPVSKVFLSVVYAISCQPWSEIVNETCLELKVRIRFHTVCLCSNLFSLLLTSYSAHTWTMLYHGYVYTCIGFDSVYICRL